MLENNKNIFNNIGLIGLGLIGGSLARAIKKDNLANIVTGYAKSSQSLNAAAEIGMIDKAAGSLKELASNCDIIIICTPLSTYENIFKELSNYIKGREVIITDVGSLKFYTIELAERYFSKENNKLFIPAHPIAGTEKTGVNSGFAELFNGKKTILTPSIYSSKEALDKVSRLWKLCGSNIEILDAKTHDKIYAEVSHLPQFLAYCYASLLPENILSGKLPEQFWKFSRICASDPVIWLDIFNINKNNLMDSLDNFIKYFDGIKFHSIYTDLPAIISQSLIKYSNSKEYAGSGFKDFTSYNKKLNLNSDGSNIEDNFILKIKELSSYINSGDDKNAMEFMSNASIFYRKFREDFYSDINNNS